MNELQILLLVITLLYFDVDKDIYYWIQRKARNFLEKHTKNSSSKP